MRVTGQPTALHWQPLGLIASWLKSTPIRCLQWPEWWKHVISMYAAEVRVGSLHCIVLT
jgi:hypothetical protein